MQRNANVCFCFDYCGVCLHLCIGIRNCMTCMLLVTVVLQVQAAGGAAAVLRSFQHHALPRGRTLAGLRDCRHGAGQQKVRAVSC
jgi:hypothetical protein